MGGRFETPIHRLLWPIEHGLLAGPGRATVRPANHGSVAFVGLSRVRRRSLGRVAGYPIACLRLDASGLLLAHGDAAQPLGRVRQNGFRASAGVVMPSAIGPNRRPALFLPHPEPRLPPAESFAVMPHRAKRPSGKSPQINGKPVPSLFAGSFRCFRARSDRLSWPHRSGAQSR